MIQPGEFAGFVPKRPVLYKSVKKEWFSSLAPAQAAAWRAYLRRDGFKVMLVENLRPTSGSDRAALSWVTQFRSAAAAKAEVGVTAWLAAASHSKPGMTYADFKVDKIPGARGFHDTRPGFVGDNIVFSDGPFVYLVGNGWDAQAKNPPARARLLAAAMSLYKRVRGHPPA